MRRYLVVANQTLAGHLLEHGRQCLGGRSWFVVLVPATPVHLQAVPVDGDAEFLARRRLEGALARFRSEGASAVGAMGDPRPLGGRRVTRRIVRRNHRREVAAGDIAMVGGRSAEPPGPPDCPAGYAPRR
jgi:hypothetical protein